MYLQMLGRTYQVSKVRELYWTGAYGYFLSYARHYEEAHADFDLSWRASSKQYRSIRAFQNE